MRRVTLNIFIISSIASLCYGCCRSEDFDLEGEIPSQETRFFACISMSMPNTTIKEISNHLESIGGSFVLRGFPGNSFNEFILKVQQLRSMGINANIQIDPDLFDECDVEVVPTFLYFPHHKKSEALSAEALSRASEDTSYLKYKKVVGNVSVPWVLREIGVLE